MPQGATASEKSGATSASNSIEVPWRFLLNRGINDHSARTTDVSIVFRFLPSKKSVARFREKLRALLAANPVTPIPTLVGWVNRLLNGWKHYFAWRYPRMAFRDVNRFQDPIMAV